MAGIGSRSELLNLLGDVKARVQDKIGIVDFPMPQFILIGKQSVGKSRLIEALAGETFNFISGTLGSRRPTILEFRNVVGSKASRWFVRDRQTGHWNEHEVSKVMQLVGDAHEELGETVSQEPICVRVQSPSCVDMQIVDLPGFRDFALDQIEELVMTFMRDPRNVMLCVEQCGDAATMSTLGKCRQIDPNPCRTILVRTKLDKYYTDLTKENVNQWVDGFGDLPENLVRFALTLPWWQDGEICPAESFVKMRDEFNAKDRNTINRETCNVDLKDLEGYMQTIGFHAFGVFMEKKIEHMFADAINPVLDKLRELKTKYTSKEQSLQTEYEETDPHRTDWKLAMSSATSSAENARVQDSVLGEAEIAAGPGPCEADRAAGAARAPRGCSTSAAAHPADADAGAGGPPRKRPRLGYMAMAAAEQWNLDVAGVMDWAQRRELPGVGVADLLDYRREHPEEDLAAGLSSILSDGS
eukprot:g7536.t1